MGGLDRPSHAAWKAPTGIACPLGFQCTNFRQTIDYKRKNGLVFQVFSGFSTALKNCPLPVFSFPPLYRGETEKLGCLTQQLPWPRRDE